MEEFKTAGRVEMVLMKEFVCRLNINSCSVCHEVFTTHNTMKTSQLDDQSMYGADHIIH